MSLYTTLVLHKINVERYLNYIYSLDLLIDLIVFQGVQYVKTEKNRYGLIKSVYAERNTTVGCHQCVSLDVEDPNATNLTADLVKVQFNLKFFRTI